MRMLAAVILLVFMAGCDSGNNNNDNTNPPVTNNDPAVRVNNQSASTIVTFQWSDCSATVWGGDRLNNDVIGPGSSRTFTLAVGCYDFQAINDGGVARQLMGQQANYNSTITFNFTN